MSRIDNDRLGDILRAGRRLAEIVRCGRDVFDADWTLRDAAGHQVEVRTPARLGLTGLAAAVGAGHVVLGCSP